jgi:hypothetical protein
MFTTEAGDTEKTTARAIPAATEVYTKKYEG